MEDVTDVAAELLLDKAADKRGGLRRHRVLQGGELVHVLGGDEAVAKRGDDLRMWRKVVERDRGGHHARK